ncbi:hypothetical protein BcDW1_2942 [Botrytis cinerea BcDW1]|uniref:Uncharacterized protein n=1 Tax=Botryotinia fuckeliana (strain BcDW1) TaxID=1290391 RepID=M7UNU8_BOTF1|nr:hypothetical protein BcDW1_2942 [Botrytis cinerea BcDW1]
MAEVEQANTQSSISPQTAPGLEPVLQPYSNTVPPTDNSVCLVDIPASDTAQQVPERVLPEKSVPESSDDEVEFVFSVPRRRKKKHRRLELPSKYTQINLASPISSAGVIGACPSSEKLIADMAPLLDPCSEPDEMNRARCYSVNATDKTAIFDTSIQPLKVPQSELPESSHSHISQNIPFKIPPSWYAKSILPPPSPTSSYYYAKPITVTTPEQDHAKKRKHQDSSENSNHVSSYVSSASKYLPRPNVLPSNSNPSPVYGHTGFVDFLEDPNVPTTFGGVPLPLPPHRPIIPGWQDFSWKQPGYSTPKRTPSVDPRARIFSNINDSDWHRKYYFGVVDPNCRNTQQVTFGNSPTERCAQEMVSPKTIPLITQTKPVSYPSIQTKLVPKSCHMPTKISTSAITTCPVQPSLIISSNSAAYSQPTHPVTPVRHTCPSPFPRSQVAAADIRRKPSLYRIPAWPHLLDNNKASSSGALDERQNPTCVAESNDIFFPHSNTTQEARPTTSHTQNSISSLLQTPVSHPSRSQASISISASAPAARHSPNLIIDIAQTSQDTFPFAAVAARHNKPIQKVFDTFSAIIQLPLLKQAADGRRHGPLGSERMRMYREAKRAMEKANRESEKGRIESKQGK